MMRLRFVLLFALAATPLAAQERSASPHGSLDTPCVACHRTDGWTPVRISREFNHAKLGFPLNGAHATANCRACHQTLDFARTPSSCASCHTDVHRGELGPDCATCHTSRSFLDRAAMSRAHQTTRFPLEGSHVTLDCTACHTGGAQGGRQFVGLRTDCVSCHQQEYSAAKSPDHVAGGLPRDCAGCHNASVWSRGRFNHDATSLPLTGAHRATPCLQCHTANRYRGTPSTCVACHQGDFDRTTSPNHRTVGFTTDCVACHTTTSWAGSLDHGTTTFPLTGAHRPLACSACHGDGVYAGKPTACVACHQTDYAQADPNHAAAGFNTECATCHTTTTWAGARFDHDAAFFPIYSGRHRGEWRSCADCHTTTGTYQTFTCLQCHEHSNKANVDRKHTEVNGYQYVSTECLRCHNR